MEDSQRILPVIRGTDIVDRVPIPHTCKAIEMLLPEAPHAARYHGNKKLYARGHRLTGGYDVNVVINTDRYQDIVIEQWFTTRGWLDRNRVKLRMTYCPFCGAKLWEDGSEPTMEQIASGLFGYWEDPEAREALMSVKEELK